MIEQVPKALNLRVPLLGRHIDNVAIGELADRLKQARGIKGTDIQLAVELLHAPNVLVLVSAKARSQAGNTALGELDGGIANDELHVLVLVHAIDVNRLLKIGIHKRAVNAAHAALAALFGVGFVEQDALESNLLVVIFTDIEVVVVDDEVGSARTGAVGIDAKAVLCFVRLLIANNGSPRIAAVGVLVATDHGKRLHGIIIGSVLGRTGADGRIEMAIVRDHIPNGAAVDAVLIANRRIVKQRLRVSNLGEAVLALRGVRRRQDCRYKITVRVFTHITDDELAIMDAHAADTGRNALLVGSTVILHARKALIDNFPLIRLRIDLIYSRQAAFAAIGSDAAAEIELALIAHGIAEQRSDAVERIREQQLGLTGLGIDLDQDAAAVLVGRAVLLLLSIEEGAVKHGLQRQAHGLGIKGIAQRAVHERQRVAHRRIAGAHIKPVTIARSRPSVALAAIAFVVGRITIGARNGNGTATLVVDDAIRLRRSYRRMRELFKGIPISRIVGNGTRSVFGMRRQRRYQDSGKRCHQAKCSHSSHKAITSPVLKPSFSILHFCPRLIAI